MTNFNKKFIKAFTLIEVILAIGIFLIIIVISFLTYNMTTRFSNKESTKTELVQNGRITLDRMTRELRQTEDMITLLPIVPDDPTDPPPSEIMFQNGHILDPIQYIRYYIDGEDKLHRELSHFYFDINPDNWVSWNAEDSFGNPAIQLIDDDNYIAEYIHDLEFWSDDTLITIQFKNIKNDELVDFQTKVSGRNLR